MVRFADQCALVVGLGWTCLRGLSLGKWVHNIGGVRDVPGLRRLILLPFVGLARGELNSYQPLQIAAACDVDLLLLQHLHKLAVGALSGFEYVAILAGETRSPGTRHRTLRDDRCLQ